jgi:transcriptional regulator with XRE-family HTH domain
MSKITPNKVEKLIKSKSINLDRAAIQMSKKENVSKSYLYNYLKGAKIPNLKKLNAIEAWFIKNGGEI